MKTHLVLLGLCSFLLLDQAALRAQPVLSIDINDRSFGTGTNTQAGFDSFLIESNTSITAIQTLPTVRTFGGLTVTLAGNGADLGYDDRRRDVPSNNATFTEALLLRDLVFSRDLGSGGLDVTVTGLTPAGYYRVTVWSYDNSSTGPRVSDWYANGTLVRENYTFNGSVLPANDAQYRFSFIIGASELGQLLIQGRRDPASVDANNVASFGVFLNALRIEEASPAPAILTQPAGATRRLGDRYTFRVVTEGLEPLSYQWFRGTEEITGATGSSLTLSNLTVADSGNFSVRVSNGFGTIDSDTVTLTVLPDPAPDVRQGLVSYWPLDDVVTDTEGRDSTPDLYSRNDFWLTNMTLLENSTFGQFNSALVFNGVDEHVVRVGGFPIYNNPAFTLSLWIAAVGTGQSDRRFFAESSTNNNAPLFNLGTHSAGTDNTITAFIRNDTNGVILNRRSTFAPLDGLWHHLVWVENNGQVRLYIDGQVDPTDFSYNRSGAVTLNQTALGAIVRATVGSYFAGFLDEVAVWNRELTFTEIQEIRDFGVPLPVMIIPPEITQQPVNQSVLTGGKATFSFTAVGTGPLEVQWSKDGADLEGETNVTLLLTDVALEDAGGYRAVVANSAGRATTDVATLTVSLRPPPAAELKLDFNNIGGESPADTEPGFESFALAAFGVAPTTRIYGGIEVTVVGAGVVLETRKRTAPVNSGSFTEERIFQDFIFARDTTVDEGMDIVLEFLKPNQPYEVTIWSYDNTSTPARISSWFANGTLVQSAYSFNGAALPTENGQYRFTFNTVSDSAGRVLIQGRRDATATVASINVFANALRIAERQLRVLRTEWIAPNQLRLSIEVLDPSHFFNVVQTTDILNPTWTEVPGVTLNGPVGNTLEATFTVPDAGPRYYRVVETP